MNKRFFLPVIAVLAALTGCAPQSTIVLVPDADGHVGRIVVTGQGGEAVLDRGNAATTTATGEKPGPVQVLDQARIDKDWADALAAMPDRPVTFQIYFTTGTADPVPEAAPLIAQALAVVKARPYPFVMIAGHADAVGSDDVNDRISRRRAEIIRDLLVNQGVPSTRIKSQSHGKRNPLIPTPDGVAEPRNRRVTLTVQ